MYQGIIVLRNFVWFAYFIPNILSGIVGWQEINIFSPVLLQSTL